MCPQGRFLHVPPIEPDAEWEPDFAVPWWEDEARYCIGNLTRRTRQIRIINTLTKHDDVIEVASEESLNEILDRYLDKNVHAASYTCGRPEEGSGDPRHSLLPGRCVVCVSAALQSYFSLCEML